MTIGTARRILQVRNNYVGDQVHFVPRFPWLFVRLMRTKLSAQIRDIWPVKVVFDYSLTPSLNDVLVPTLDLRGSYEVEREEGPFSYLARYKKALYFR